VACVNPEGMFPLVKLIERRRRESNPCTGLCKSQRLTGMLRRVIVACGGREDRGATDFLHKRWKTLQTGYDVWCRDLGPTWTA
jgi:hypothetical protein